MFTSPYPSWSISRDPSNPFDLQTLAKYLWINSDSGLKSSKYGEVVSNLTNIVTATKQLRAELICR